jgi:hypothetical protein
MHTRIVDGFTFLYSEAQQTRYLASRRNLLGHKKVLEQAMHAGHRTLLPLQFGLIIEDWGTVTEQLTAPHSETLGQRQTILGCRNRTASADGRGCRSQRTARSLRRKIPQHG